MFMFHNPRTHPNPHPPPSSGAPVYPQRLAARFVALPFFAEPFGDGAGFASAAASAAFEAAFAGGAGFAGRNTCAVGGEGVRGGGRGGQTAVQIMRGRTGGGLGGAGEAAGNTHAQTTARGSAPPPR